MKAGSCGSSVKRKGRGGGDTPVGTELETERTGAVYKGSV